MTKSNGYYIAMYAVYVVMALGMLYAITFAVARFAPDLYVSLFQGGGGAGASVVVMVLPPMLIAQQFYRHEKRRMGRAQSWGLAFVFTLIFAAIIGAATYVLHQIFPMPAAQMAELRSIFLEDFGFTAVFAGFVALFVLMTNKLMLWAGIRGAIKQEEKLAAKAAKRGS